VLRGFQDGCDDLLRNGIRAKGPAAMPPLDYLTQAFLLVADAHPIPS
jgi:hypothetical protein